MAKPRSKPKIEVEEAAPAAAPGFVLGIGSGAGFPMIGISPVFCRLAALHRHPPGDLLLLQLALRLRLLRLIPYNLSPFQGALSSLFNVQPPIT